MNFQAVRDAEGQMDGQYQRKVPMLGTPQRVEDATFTPQGKKIQQVTITDDIGEMQKVKIYGGKMQNSLCGQKLSFEIAPYTSNRNNQVYYSGFWNDRATTGQASQQAPQKPQQTPPAQEPFSMRQTAWLGACRFATVHKNITSLQELIQIAQAGAHFIQTGLNLVEEKKLADDRKESYVDEPIREPGEDN